MASQQDNLMAGRAMGGRSERVTDFRQLEPTLLVNPPDDEQFAADARNGLAAGATTPDRLQGVLRARYPATVVRRRDLAGEQFVVWYVYRDGHWTAAGRLETQGET
jgi:hypothetical protein